MRENWEKGRRLFHSLSLQCAALNFANATLRSHAGRNEYLVLY